jgi:hypothetical protein
LEPYLNSTTCLFVPNTHPSGQVAQLVEQRTENPRVGGSIPSLATTFPFRFPENHNRYELLKGIPVIDHDGGAYDCFLPSFSAGI